MRSYLRVRKTWSNLHRLDVVFLPFRASIQHNGMSWACDESEWLSYDQHREGVEGKG